MGLWAQGGADPAALPDVLGALAIASERAAVGPGSGTASAARVARLWGARAALWEAARPDAAGAFVQAWDQRIGVDVRLIPPTGPRTPVSLRLIRDGAATSSDLTDGDGGAPFSTADRAYWAALAAEVGQARPHWLLLEPADGTLGLLEELVDLPDPPLCALRLGAVPRRISSAFAVERALRRSHLAVIPEPFLDGWVDYLAPLDRPSERKEQCASLLGALIRLSPTLRLGLVTRAADGLVAQARGAAPFALPAYRGQAGRPIPVIDPSGAEDVLLGVLLAGLRSSSEVAWSARDRDDLEGLLTRASVAAALSCARLGAVAHVPTEVEVAAEMAEARRQLSPTRLTAWPGRFDGPGHVPAPQTPLARLNLGILAATERTIGQNDHSRLVEDVERTRTLVAVGSGSSFSVALAIARLVHRCLPAPYAAAAYSPGEYLALGRPGETVILVTQGGNPDIAAADRHARRLDVDPFLITARDAGRWLNTFLPGHVLRHAGEPAESFVNVRGPCAALALVLEWLAGQSGRAIPTLEEYRQRHESARAQVEALDTEGVPPTAHMIALASGLMAPALHELDLKMAESARSAEAGDLKGWTHGRFQRPWSQRLLRRHAFVVFETPADADVVDALAERVGRVEPEPMPFLRLRARDDALGLWQHLVHAMLLVERLADDPSGLSVPPPLRGLNRGIALTAAGWDATS